MITRTVPADYCHSNDTDVLTPNDTAHITPNDTAHIASMIPRSNIVTVSQGAACPLGDAYPQVFFMVILLSHRHGEIAVLRQREHRYHLSAIII